VSADNLQLVISLWSLGIATIGLPILYLQLRDVSRSLQVSTHAAIYERASEFRGHLVEHPHLRKYFFDGVEILPGDEDYSQVVTLAEIFLNYLEHIAVLGDSFGKKNRPALDMFVATALKKGPILGTHLANNPELYSEALHRFCRK
jgi:hypothetical protein